MLRSERYTFNKTTYACIDNIARQHSATTHARDGSTLNDGIIPVIMCAHLLASITIIIDMNRSMVLVHVVIHQGRYSAKAYIQCQPYSCVVVVVLCCRFIYMYSNTKRKRVRAASSKRITGMVMEYNTPKLHVYFIQKCTYCPEYICVCLSDAEMRACWICNYIGYDYDTTTPHGKC